MSVAAVVVTYNRKEELVKNLKAVMAQTLLVDRYYIIDNHGNDGTETKLQEEGFLDKEVLEDCYPQRDFHDLYVGEIIKVLKK